MDLDKLFYKLSNTDEAKNAMILKVLALNGFITLERIYKLVSCKDAKKLNEVIQAYFKTIEDSLEALEEVD